MKNTFQIKNKRCLSPFHLCLGFQAETDFGGTGAPHLFDRAREVSVAAQSSGSSQESSGEEDAEDFMYDPPPKQREGDEEDFMYDPPPRVPSNATDSVHSFGEHLHAYVTNDQGGVEPHLQMHQDALDLLQAVATAETEADEQHTRTQYDNSYNAFAFLSQRDGRARAEEAGLFDVVDGWRGEAIADYDAATPEEISFRENDLIHVEHKHHNGWWIGCKKGSNKRGLFPGSFVQLSGACKIDVPKALGLPQLPTCGQCISAA